MNTIHPEFIRQGKYECAAACLAMLLGHTLFNVKQALGAVGWRNDSEGVWHHQTREVARMFERDLISGNKNAIKNFNQFVIPKVNMPNCMLTIPSMNYEGKFHAVTWLDGKILDPNNGVPGRKFWPVDSNPFEMGATHIEVLTKAPLTEVELKHIKEVGMRKDILAQSEFIQEMARLAA